MRAHLFRLLKPKAGERLYRHFFRLLLLFYSLTVAFIALAACFRNFMSVPRHGGATRTRTEIPETIRVTAFGTILFPAPRAMSKTAWPAGMGRDLTASRPRAGNLRYVGGYGRAQDTSPGNLCKGDEPRKRQIGTMLRINDRGPLCREGSSIFPPKAPRTWVAEQRGWQR